MKIFRALLVVCLVASLAYCGCAKEQAKQIKGTLTISGAWAIYPTVVAWAEAFQKKYPGVKIDVSAGGAGKGAADAIAGLVDIGMVSRQPDQSEIEKGIFPVYVLHDAVFPVISADNPALEVLVKKGITKQQFTDMYITGTITSWDQLTGEKSGKPLHVYTRSDSCGAAASWAAFMGKKQEDLKGVGIYGDPGLLEQAKRDPIGIGYANFSYVFTRQGTMVAGSRIPPIDADENGAVDPEELITSREEAVKAIESGKYPVTRRNFLFVKGRPQGLTKQFIEFCLSDEGTAIVDQVGTSLPLPKDDREKVLQSIK